MEYYSATRKKDIFPFVTTLMDLEHFMLRQIATEGKEPYDITYMRNLKKPYS